MTACQYVQLWFLLCSFVLPSLSHFYCYVAFIITPLCKTSYYTDFSRGKHCGSLLILWLIHLNHILKWSVFFQTYTTLYKWKNVPSFPQPLSFYLSILSLFCVDLLWWFTVKSRSTTLTEWGHWAWSEHVSVLCTFLMRSLASIVKYGGKLSLHFRILSMVFFLFSAVNGG